MTNLILPLSGVIEYPGSEAKAASVLIETKESGVSYPSRVMVLDRQVGTLYWSGFTDEDGQKRVIVPKAYATKNDLLVVAVEDTSTYNAVVADKVQAELLQ